MPLDKRFYMTFPNDFHRHPKLTRLPVEVRWAFVEMNGEARIADNDGVFTVEEAEFLWPKSVLDQLVRSHPTRPLVLLEGDQYVIRDYADHQETRERRAERKATNTANGRRGGRPRKNPTETDSVTERNRTITEPKAELEIEIEKEGYVTKDSLVSSEVVPTSRPDVDFILGVLEEELARNGSRIPTRSKRNIDAARLLIDRDGKTVDQIVRAIRWSQADEFWRSNILSMSKLREKYDQLRLAADRKRSSSRGSKDDQALAVLAMGARLQQQEIEQ